MNTSTTIKQEINAIYFNTMQGVPGSKQRILLFICLLKGLVDVLGLGLVKLFDLGARQERFEEEKAGRGDSRPSEHHLFGQARDIDQNSGQQKILGQCLAHAHAFQRLLVLERTDTDLS
jgi:hypothetical protein